MKKRLVIFLTIVLFIPLVGCNYQKEEDNSTAIGDNFSIAFLKLAERNKNIIYSPLSIKYALNMLNDGADGNTKKQIENLIKGLTLTNYKNIDEYLSFANAIFVRDEYKSNIRQTFIDTLSNKYSAEVQYDQFKNATNINNFIERKTLGIIKNMLSDDTVNNINVKMIILNALAIDMKWAEEFNANYTSGIDFTLADDSKILAATMQKVSKGNNISYYQDDNLTALGMNLKKYGDVQLEFIALMPRKNLSEYVDNFQMKEFDSVRNKMTLASDTEAGIEIFIPRFKYDYSFLLKNNLINLGVIDVFDREKADLSKINNGPEKLFVSDAFHKADIEFTEGGIKAAAVTTIIVDASSIPKNQPKEIKIDRPFLYFIRDKVNGEIWFVGTVYQPELWKN